MPKTLSRWSLVALEAAVLMSIAHPSVAAEPAASQASGVVDKTENAVKRGAKAAERGLVTAASAAERGIAVATGAASRGASAAIRGVSTAGSAVERTAKRLGVPASSSPSASAPQ
ncbi:MAG TPA: hypothetical protein VHQ87_14905 [Rhizobacter sp.]|jgi:hypothetical protein|nr:hypothetical protein [Rhizobacter sp.]